LHLIAATAAALRNVLGVVFELFTCAAHVTLVIVPLSARAIVFVVVARGYGVVAADAVVQCVSDGRREGRWLERGEVRHGLPRPLVLVLVMEVLMLTIWP
jgi:hypothetical protein